MYDRRRQTPVLRIYRALDTRSSVVVLGSCLGLAKLVLVASLLVYYSIVQRLKIMFLYALLLALTSATMVAASLLLKMFPYLWCRSRCRWSWSCKMVLLAPLGSSRPAECVRVTAATWKERWTRVGSCCVVRSGVDDGWIACDACHYHLTYWTTPVRPLLNRPLHRPRLFAIQFSGLVVHVKQSVSCV